MKGEIFAIRCEMGDLAWKIRERGGRCERVPTVHPLLVLRIFKLFSMESPSLKKWCIKMYHSTGIYKHKDFFSKELESFIFPFSP